ncbi:MAG: sarcosine oxidase subunit gamma [Alphaproteobacteria bacterium]|nr:sarcosine oxidase subunit gamma [Alphaproteobacteria bacterium]
MAERLSALAPAYRAGSFGAEHASGPGITLAERRGLAMVQVAAIDGEIEAVRRGITTAVGLTPDAQPNRAVSSGRTTALWVGPGRFLIVEPERADASLEGLLRSALPASQAALVDLGSSRTVLRVSGPRSRDLIAKGCPMDLHVRAFPAGACAQTLLGHVQMLVHAVDDASTLDIYVARSFGLTVWEFLTESAAEYGYRVEATAA